MLALKKIVWIENPIDDSASQSSLDCLLKLNRVRMKKMPSLIVNNRLITWLKKE
jgi:hypothetical protein